MLDSYNGPYRGLSVNPIRRLTQGGSLAGESYSQP
jgi:hypothetical protein